MIGPGNRLPGSIRDVSYANTCEAALIVTIRNGVEPPPPGNAPPRDDEVGITVSIPVSPCAAERLHFRAQPDAHSPKPTLTILEHDVGVAAPLVIRDEEIEVTVGIEVNPTDTPTAPVSVDNPKPARAIDKATFATHHELIGSISLAHLGTYGAVQIGTPIPVGLPPLAMMSVHLSGSWASVTGQANEVLW